MRLCENETARSDVVGYIKLPRGGLAWLAAAQLDSFVRMPVSTSIMDNLTPDLDRVLTKPELAALLDRGRLEGGGWTTLALFSLNFRSNNPKRVDEFRAEIAKDPAWPADHVAIVEGVSIAELRTLARITSLKSLVLFGLDIDAEGAAALAALTRLTSLDLQNNSIGDEGAAALAALTGLTSLDLGYNRLTLTVQLVETLKGMKSLTFLDLKGNAGLSIKDEELDAKRAATIIERLEAKLGGTARPWREVKIALLGDGEVGKSMLRWRVAPLSKDEPPPEHGPRGRTRAWERRKITFSKVPKGVTGDAPGGHVFDFGGQDFLWGSHRLFLSARRSIYVVVARADKPIDRPGNRVMHWMDLVADMRRECIDARVEAERTTCEDRHRDGHDIHEGSGTHGARGLRGAGRFDEKVARRAAEERFPVLPVLVVITHRRSLNERSGRSEDQVKRETASLRAKLNPRGASVLEVDIGESDEHAQRDAAQVKLAIEDELVVHPAFAGMWASAEPPTFFTIKDRLEKLFTDPEDEPKTKPWLTLEEYDKEIAIGIDLKLAREYVLNLRDIGLVHYVGDVRGLKVYGADIRGILYNPLWTRYPVYHVLWDRMGQGLAVGVYKEKTLLDQIVRGIVGTPPQRLSPYPAQAVLELMQACELIFEAGLDEERRRAWVVPDQLNAETGITASESFDVLVRWRLDFVPDSAMPRLIGALWKDKRGGPTRDRLGLQYEGGTAELVREGARDGKSFGSSIVFTASGGRIEDREGLRGQVMAAVRGVLPSAPAPEVWRRGAGAAATLGEAKGGTAKTGDAAGTAAQMKWLTDNSRTLKFGAQAKAEVWMETRLARVKEILISADAAGLVGVQRTACMLMAVTWYFVWGKEPTTKIPVDTQTCKLARKQAIRLNDDQLGGLFNGQGRTKREEFVEWSDKALQTAANDAFAMDQMVVFREPLRRV